MKALILFLVIVPNIALADWVIPSTGIVDYSNQQSSTLPTFDIPAPSTINQPLPEWSQTPAPAQIQEYVPSIQPYTFSEQ